MMTFTKADAIRSAELIKAFDKNQSTHWTFYAQRDALEREPRAINEELNKLLAKSGAKNLTEFYTMIRELSEAKA